jgi:hypothetical protein
VAAARASGDALYRFSRDVRADGSSETPLINLSRYARDICDIEVGSEAAVEVHEGKIVIRPADDD